MKKVLCDIEANGLNPDTIWCVVCKELDTEEVRVFLQYDAEQFRAYAETVDQWIGHNFLQYDAYCSTACGVPTLKPHRCSTLLCCPACSTKCGLVGIGSLSSRAGRTNTACASGVSASVCIKATSTSGTGTAKRCWTTVSRTLKSYTPCIRSS